jgi:hypothetical protein
MMNKEIARGMVCFFHQKKALLLNLYMYIYMYLYVYVYIVGKHIFRSSFFFASFDRDTKRKGPGGVVYVGSSQRLRIRINGLWVRIPTKEYIRCWEFMHCNAVVCDFIYNASEMRKWQKIFLLRSSIQESIFCMYAFFRGKMFSAEFLQKLGFKITRKNNSTLRILKTVFLNGFMSPWIKLRLANVGAISVGA